MKVLIETVFCPFFCAFIEHWNLQNTDMPQNQNDDDKNRTGNEKPRFLRAFFDEETALDKKGWIIDKYISRPILRLLTELSIPATIARPIAITLTLLLFVGLVYLVIFALLALFVFISHIF